MLKSYLNAVFVILIILGCQEISAQKNQNYEEVYIIESIPYNDYEYINVPNKNFIIKRGGIADLKTLAGLKVKVISTIENKKGTQIATIKRVDGHKFFGAYNTVTVAIKKALTSGELRRVR